MNARSVFLAATLFCAACSGSILRADEIQKTVPAEPLVQIITATGKTKFAFKKATIVAEAGDESHFTAYVTVDNFPKEIGSSLRVKVNDMVFTPSGYGGDNKSFWSLDLRDVDRASAEILNGGPLPKAPKDSFTLEYIPYKKIFPLNDPIQFGIALTNNGKVPLQVYYMTNGGRNYECRDTQLAFTATLDGAKVPVNPKPLPDGFVSSPFILKPNSSLQWDYELTEWLQFEKPGKYLIDAAYTLEIVNPEKGVMPSSWKVTYHNQFSIQVG